MTRLVAAILSASIVLSVILGALAGPACARRNRQSVSCISECEGKWGFPGSIMGSDPWGVVMKPMSGDLATAIADACDLSTQDQPSSSPSQTPQAVESSVSMSSVSISSSPSAVIAAPSTTSSMPTKTDTVSQSHAISPSQVISPTTTPTTSTTQPPPEKSSPPTTVHTITTTSATPPPPTSSPSSSGPGSGLDINVYLNEHNSFRTQHGAAPLLWSNKLADYAQQWANGCVFKHPNGSHGENLAAGTGPNYDIHAAIKSWTDESSTYTPGNPLPSHFTQVVWRSSTQVGCAHAECKDIFPSNFGLAKFFVCEYSPPGNVIGQFSQNVQP